MREDSHFWLLSCQWQARQNYVCGDKWTYERTEIIKQNAHSRCRVHVIWVLFYCWCCCCRCCCWYISSLAYSLLHQCDSDTIRWSYVFVLSVLYVRYGYCRFSLEAENAFWEIPICDSLQKNIYVCIEHIVLAFRSWRRWLWNSFLSSSSYFFLSFGYCCFCRCTIIAMCKSHTGSTDTQFQDNVDDMIMLCCAVLCAKQEHRGIEYSAMQRARTLNEKESVLAVCAIQMNEKRSVRESAVAYT